MTLGSCAIHSPAAGFSMGAPEEVIVAWLSAVGLARPVDWPGRSEDKKANPKTVHAFVVANATALDMLRQELPRVIKMGRVPPGKPGRVAHPSRPFLQNHRPRTARCSTG